MSGTFSSLGSRTYRIWFMGTLVSNAGTWMQATVQNWVVLAELTDNNATAVGVTIGLQLGPQLLLVPWSGVVADRFDRRHILLVTQTMMVLLGLLLGILTLAGVTHLWHLFLFAFLFGCTNAFDAPARQAMVGDLVAHEHLTNAVALNSASWNTARLVGPALAGILIVAVGSGWVFIINATAFLSAITALLIMKSEPVVVVAAKERFWAQVRVGLKYVTQRPNLIAAFCIAFVMGGFGMNSPIFTSTMSMMFGRGPAGYGFLSSIFAVGAIVGALLAARRKGPKARIITVAAGAYGILSAIAALMPTFEAYAAMTILTGFAIVSTTITTNGYVQEMADPKLRGRVMALYMATMMGGAPVGALFAGWIADTYGARWSVGVGAGAGIVACIIGIVWQVLAARSRRQIAEVTPATVD